MAKVFVNYRREDARDMAARVRDRLANALGNANVFMDVDNLMAGQRFDRELEKALAETGVFLAVIGPRWMELLAQRHASGERDFVREEIAGALARGIVVIPILIEGAPLPRADALPPDIRSLVMHQKHNVTHEQFGRDVAGLVEAIRFATRASSRNLPLPRLRPELLGWMTAGAVSSLAAAWIAAHYAGVPVPWPSSAPRDERATVAAVVPTPASRKAEDDARAAADARRMADLAEQVRREQEARVRAENESKRLADLAAQSRRELEARQKAEPEAAAKRKAEAVVSVSGKTLIGTRTTQTFQGKPNNTVEPNFGWRLDPGGKAVHTTDGGKSWNSQQWSWTQSGRQLTITRPEENFTATGTLNDNVVSGTFAYETGSRGVFTMRLQ